MLYDAGMMRLILIILGCFLGVLQADAAGIALDRQKLDLSDLNFKPYSLVPTPIEGDDPPTVTMSYMPDNQELKKLLEAAESSANTPEEKARRLYKMHVNDLVTPQERQKVQEIVALYQGRKDDQVIIPEMKKADDPFLQLFYYQLEWAGLLALGNPKTLPQPVYDVAVNLTERAFHETIISHFMIQQLLLQRQSAQEKQISISQYVYEVDQKMTDQDWASIGIRLDKNQAKDMLEKMTKARDEMVRNLKKNQESLAILTGLPANEIAITPQTLTQIPSPPARLSLDLLMKNPDIEYLRQDFETKLKAATDSDFKLPETFPITDENGNATKELDSFVRGQNQVWQRASLAQFYGLDQMSDGVQKNALMASLDRFVMAVYLRSTNSYSILKSLENITKDTEKMMIKIHKDLTDYPQKYAELKDVPVMHLLLASVAADALNDLMPYELYRIIRHNYTTALWMSLGIHFQID